VIAAVPLGEVCAQDRVSVRAGERPDLRYLGLESIEPHSGRLSDGELSKTPEVPEANAFVFTEAHVLYGKLRPYLNKVYVPPFAGKCSTELIPLLPSERVQREYLGYFLRAPSTVEKISQRVAGARMPRAEMPFVMSLDIPLPPLSEQSRTVDLLSRAENIVRMRREAEQKSKEIIPALFLDMFGDPATNPKRWDRKSLSEIVESIDSGKSPPCIDRLRYADEWGVLKLGSVTWGSYDETEHKTLPPTTNPFLQAEVRRGDVLLSRKNTYDLVGAPAYVWDTRGQILLPDLIFRLNIGNSERVDGIYLWALLSTASKRSQLRLLASGAAASMPNISKGRLSGLGIEVPPMPLQRRFSALASHARAIELQHAYATSVAYTAFQSLLAGVFGGDQQNAEL
jgi:type I restriction enzyme S subunit